MSERQNDDAVILSTGAMVMLMNRQLAEAEMHTAAGWIFLILSITFPIQEAVFRILAGVYLGMDVFGLVKLHFSYPPELIQIWHTKRKPALLPVVNTMLAVTYYVLLLC